MVWSLFRAGELKTKEKEEGEKKMTLCLYECLRAVGLQHLYAGFTSVGVCHTAHLSVLTIEDYPLLGIHTMEDRTRFFQLVQFIKTLDLVDDDDDDYDYSLSGCDEGGTTDCHDSYGTSHDEDGNAAAVSNLIASTFARPSHVCRQLDFSNETSHHHQRSSHPALHVNVRHARYEALIQGKGSATSVRHHYKQKSKPAIVASRTFNHKPLGHKDRKGTTKKKSLHTEMCADGCMCKATPVYEAKRTAGYNYGLPLSTPPAQSKQQSEEQRIKVCVRKRPLTCAESRRGEVDVVTTPLGECVVVHEGKEAVDLSEYILQHKFYFDQVFGEESSNEEVYRKTAHPLVQHMLKGGKVTCFAYGQTGAGKTHTMLGSPTRPGLYALAVQDIFAHLSTTHSSQLVYVSFFEIYCGQLYDLLDHRKRLYAREDGQRMVHISGLRDVRVDSVSSLLEVISQGTAERTQGMSGVNPLSSRSHALLHIQLRDPNQQLAGRMWFVDLAGSERASDAKEPDRQSRLEAAEINQSLLALKECIRSLDQEQMHTPFRQSKLTQVLKDSFVGDSMTCMIANISPGHTAAEHTLNTLRYADRVKELRRQRGLRGRRKNRSKTALSPKHNVFSSTADSSVTTRGKSPPKKPKLTKQSEAFGPTTPTTRSPMGSVFLCSTPKISKCGDEVDARGRGEIGLEHITPVRGWLRMGDKRHRSNGADDFEGGRIGNDRYESTVRQSVCEQNPGAVLVLGQPKDKQAHSWKVQKEGEAHEVDLSSIERKSEFCSREKDEQYILKGGIEKGKKNRDANSKGERLRQSELPKANEMDKERERHLRWYHKQLQQFIPSSASSSIHLLSPSLSLSSSSSTQGSVSHLSISSHMSHGLEQVLDGYTARSEVRVDGNRGKGRSPSGEIQLQTEISSVSSNINEEAAHGDSGGVWENSRVSLEGMQAGFGQERSKRSRETSSEERQRRKERGRAGMEGGEGKWAWMANRTAGVIPKNFEAQLSRSCDSQDRLEVGVAGLEASDDPADGVWSTEKGEAARKECLLSAHSNNYGNNLISHPPFELPQQRAPAERPLSPPCEHISALLTSDLLSEVSFESRHTRCISEAAPSSSHREKELWFDTTVSKRPFLHAQSATLPLTSSITPPESLNKLPVNPAHIQVHNHSEVKMMASPQNETQADYFSSIMDPLSISQLQVDRQAATVSFLRGDNSNTEVSPLKNESGKDSKWEEVEKVVEDENVGLQLSFVELPQVKTHHPPVSDTMTAANHTEGKQDIQLANCYTGIPEGFLGSLQDQASCQKQTPQALLNKPATSPLKKATRASAQMFLPSLHDLITKEAQVPQEHAHNDHKKTPLACIKTPQLESVSGYTLPSQCDAGRSKPTASYNLTTLLQPNNLGESNGEESTSNHQVRPTIHLFNLDDLDHVKWSIFRAHWEQLKEMEALCLKEGKLLCQQPDMAFGEYVHKLEEIMEKKAWCVHRIRAQLQPYLKPIPSNHPQGADNHSPTC